MIKKIITEISEEDFRKLNLRVGRNENVKISENIPGHPLYQMVMTDVSLNDIIDRQIKATVELGTAEAWKDLNTPLTIAIHEPGGYYLDKFMNRFTGAQTYQIGWGIPHLYSSRDYYECRDGDYWRVSKKETKVIYRIRLADHWFDEFVLKHRVLEIDWPYDFLPEGVSGDYVTAKLCCHQDLQENGKWKEICRTAKFIYGSVVTIIPVDEYGKKITLDCEKE